jgi:hypothetical protein
MLKKGCKQEDSCGRWRKDGLYGRAELQYNLVILSNTLSKCNRGEKEAVVYTVDLAGQTGRRATPERILTY